MGERGAIAVDRGVFGHPRFADEPYTEREAWIWMISEAAFKAHKRRVGPAMLSLRRGQLAHSVRFMAAAWKWSVGRVRRFLKMLANDLGPDDEPLIDVSITAGITVVSIRKYNGYQRVIRYDDPPTSFGAGTPTGTPIDTGQKELGLCPRSEILSGPEKSGTPIDTAMNTDLAQERHRLESIDKTQEEEEEGVAPADRNKIATAWSQITDDRGFAEKILRIIRWPMPEHASVGVSHMVTVWRERRYDPAWIIAIAAEIALMKPKGGFTLNYLFRAIAARHDARAGEIAANVCPTITLPPPRPTESNGHAAKPPLHSTDDPWKQRREHAARVVEEFRKHVRGQSNGEGS